MTKAEQRQLITTNAAIWAVIGVVTFVAPLVITSVTSGRGGFLSMLLHLGSMIGGMQTTNALIAKAVGKPTDA